MGTSDSGPASDGGFTELPDGGLLYPDGGVVLPDSGIVVLPDGGIELPDSGPAEDGGTMQLPDGGTVLPDGGVSCPPNQQLTDAGTCAPSGPGNIGAPCTPGSASDCAPGLTCQSVDSTTMCSQTGCMSNADCGSTGEVENICLNGVCYRGCDPLVANDCGRSDFGCSTEGGQNHCAPGCNAPGAPACAYGTICSQTSGTCVAQACTGSGRGNCPSTSEVCGAPLGASVCVPDCRNDTSVCPSGTTCDSKGVCEGLSDVGAPCTDGNSTSQSDCQDGYTCVAFGSNTNECTILGCLNNTDCGTNGALQNVCVPNQSVTGVCYRACDPSVPSSCGRSDLICNSFQDQTGATESLCIPDCRLQTESFCQYGSTCDSTTGVCQTLTCTGSGRSNCNPGQVCGSFNGVQVCVPDCRTTSPSPCPFSTVCGADGTCSTIADIGANCIDSMGDQQSNCAQGLTCVAQGGVNMCTVGCSTDADCGMDGSVQNVCLLNSMFGVGTCFRGCTMGESNGCGRPDLVCSEVTGTLSGQPETACVGDCRQQMPGYCAAGTTCNQMTGQCQTTPCTKQPNGSFTCPSGEVCNAQHDCVPDCRTTGITCPSGTQCDSTGECVAGAGVGAACASGDFSQSTCAAGFFCEPLSAANYCSEQCFDNSGCGTNGSSANVCVFDQILGTSMCRRGCDPTASGSCNRSDLICVAVTDVTGLSDNACLPDCRVAGNSCSLGFTCDSTTGQCTQTLCSGTGQANCPAGQKCANVNGMAVCQADCSMPGFTCPAGTTCDSNGICNAAADVGAPCTDSSQMGQSNCASGYVCSAAPGVNECTQVCAPWNNTSCGSNGSFSNVCVGNLQTGGGLCYLGCDPTNPSSCGRSDMTCVSQTDPLTGIQENVCVANCTSQPAGFCAYGTVCSTSTGQCAPEPCTGTGQSSCASGFVCGPVNGASVCVPPCTGGAITCLTGTACDANGACTPEAGLGVPCADSSQHGQSTCSSGFNCIAVGSSNQCTILGCTSDSQCGSNGAFTNLCLQDQTLGQPACFQACDPAVANSCGSGMVCGTQVDPQTGRGVNYCVPSCAGIGDTACIYGQVCQASSGQCVPVTCSGAGQANCAAGEVCTPLNGQTVCAADCRKDGVACPSGTACDSDTGECLVGAGLGVPCDAPGTQSSCSAGFTCATIANTNMCTKPCTQNSDCGTNDVCFGSECVVGCSASTPGSCGRSDLTCSSQPNPITFGATNDICLLNCSVDGAGACAYGTTCSASNVCAAQPCSGTGQGSCAAGQFCVSVNGSSVCASDCRASGVACPSGTACDSAASPTAGECTVGAGIGAVCNAPGSQSTCSSGYTCETVFGADICTAACQSNDQCGTTNGIPDACLNGVCAQGCAPATSGTCPTGLVCGSEPDAASGRNDNVCVSDCRSTGAPACDYPTTCNSGSGLCTATSCTGTGQGNCQSGDVCASFGGQFECVPDCRSSSNACPSGYACQADGSCLQQAGAYYQPCIDGTTCNAGLSCVAGASSSGVSWSLCLTNCATNSDCPMDLGTSQCAFQLQTGQLICGLTCTPGTTTCPGVTTCVSFGGPGAFCIPPQ